MGRVEGNLNSSVKASSMSSTKPNTHHRVQSSPGKPAAPQGLNSGQKTRLPGEMHGEEEGTWSSPQNIKLNYCRLHLFISMLLIQRTHFNMGLCPGMEVQVAPIFSSPLYATSPGVNIVYGLLVSFDYFY